MSEKQQASGVVADGHCIHLGGNRVLQSGDTFVASPDEVQRLRASGFLADPRLKIVPHPLVRGAGMRVALPAR
jgi:hypothetical protein